ncbi:MAG: tetratricopeptide repeat protein [candidate division Zixibacteria bacterium]|nr:tetratricopeptide repeat protein [candidate division Zixibacteria bacterium]
MIETSKTHNEATHPNQTVKSASTPDPHANPRPSEKTDDNDLDFVVTEAHDQDSDLVGGFNKSNSDDLGIETPADLMEAEALDTGECVLPDPVMTSSIGDTNPPLPTDKQFDSDLKPATETMQDTIQDLTTKQGLGKLTDERLQEISQKMQGETPNNNYLTAEEKQRLLKSIDEVPVDQVESPSPQTKPKTGFDNEPIVPPSKQKNTTAPKTSTPKPTPTQPEIELSGERPKMSGRVRGVAYFAREYIKISGGQELHEGDSMTVNNREYMLRHKKFSNKLILGIVVPLAAILIFVLGAMLSSDADTGAGQIVGLVLGDDDRPFITGTEIHFPELGKSYESNGQGFFKTDPLDAGTYKIEFRYDGQVIATDYATIVADRITTITLRPEQFEDQATNWEGTSEPIAQTAEVTPDSPTPTAKPTPPPAKPKTTPKKTATSGSRWAKLALEANVEGAKLTIDGSTLGAGNLTYPRLKPGIHKYTVSKDGYQSYRGSVDLKTGKTKTLQVILTPNVSVAKATPPPEQKPFNQGNQALDRGETTTAIASFTDAIKLNPSYAEAYLMRAKAYQQNRDSKSSYDDYVRAAEIYSSRNDFNRSLSAYNKALALNPKSIPVFLGRGNLYLSRSEEIAAIADFDMVVRLNKRNLDGYLGLGKARYNQGYFKKAIKHFKDARSIDSENPTIHSHLMMCYYRTGDFKQVGKSYDKFLKYTSETEQQKMQSDPRFAPVLKVIKD